MTSLIAWSGLAALAGGLVTVVALAVRGPMRTVLTANAHLMPAATFYIRTFVLVIALAALAGVAGTGMPCEKQSENAITVAWWIVGQLQNVCWSVGGFLMGYVVLVTILFAVLGRYRDQ